MIDFEKLRERLRVQDNRCTEHPVFTVEREERIYGVDSDYTDLFETRDEGDESFPLGYTPVWVFEAAFFTDVAAYEYADKNSHKGKLRVFVHSATNNQEWQAIRALLMADKRVEDSVEIQYLRTALAEASKTAEEMMAERNALQEEMKDELAGCSALRKRFGALENETMFMFIERLATKAGIVPTDSDGNVLQWRPVTDSTAFAPPFGTISVCRECRCLVAGDNTTCNRCVADDEIVFQDRKPTNSRPATKGRTLQPAPFILPEEPEEQDGCDHGHVGACTECHREEMLQSLRDEADKQRARADAAETVNIDDMTEEQFSDWLEATKEDLGDGEVYLLKEHNAMLLNALASVQVDVHPDASWCRICRTEGRADQRSRALHPHNLECILAIGTSNELASDGTSVYDSLKNKADALQVEVDRLLSANALLIEQKARLKDVIREKSDILNVIGDVSHVIGDAWLRYQSGDLSREEFEGTVAARVEHISKEEIEYEEIDIEEDGKKGGKYRHPLAKRYVIRVDKKKYTVNVSHMTGREILKLAGKSPPEQYKLTQKFHADCAQMIDLDEDIDFRQPGVECFMTLSRIQTEGSTPTVSSVEWNLAHPVGTAVRFWPIPPWSTGNEPIETVTRSKAWTLTDGIVAVLISGKLGCVNLAHIEVVT